MENESLINEDKIKLLAKKQLDQYPLDKDLSAEWDRFLSSKYNLQRYRALANLLYKSSLLTLKKETEIKDSDQRIILFNNAYEAVKQAELIFRTINLLVLSYGCRSVSLQLKIKIIFDSNSISITADSFNKEVNSIIDEIRIFINDFDKYGEDIASKQIQIILLFGSVIHSPVIKLNKLKMFNKAEEIIQFIKENTDKLDLRSGKYSPSFENTAKTIFDQILLVNAETLSRKEQSINGYSLKAADYYLDVSNKIESEAIKTEALQHYYRILAFRNKYTGANNDQQNFISYIDSAIVTSEKFNPKQAVFLKGFKNQHLSRFRSRSLEDRIDLIGRAIGFFKMAGPNHISDLKISNFYSLYLQSLQSELLNVERLSLIERALVNVETTPSIKSLYRIEYSELLLQFHFFSFIKNVKTMNYHSAFKHLNELNNLGGNRSSIRSYYWIGRIIGQSSRDQQKINLINWKVELETLKESGSIDNPKLRNFIDDVISYAQLAQNDSSGIVEKKRLELISLFAGEQLNLSEIYDIRSLLGYPKLSALLPKKLKERIEKNSTISNQISDPNIKLEIAGFFNYRLIGNLLDILIEGYSKFLYDEEWEKKIIEITQKDPERITIGDQLKLLKKFCHEYCPLEGMPIEWLAELEDDHLNSRNSIIHDFEPEIANLELEHLQQAIYSILKYIPLPLYVENNSYFLFEKKEPVDLKIQDIPDGIYGAIIAPSNDRPREQQKIIFVCNLTLASSKQIGYSEGTKKIHIMHYSKNRDNFDGTQLFEKKLTIDIPIEFWAEKNNENFDKAFIKIEDSAKREFGEAYAKDYCICNQFITATRKAADLDEHKLMNYMEGALYHLSRHLNLNYYTGRGLLSKEIIFGINRGRILDLSNKEVAIFKFKKMKNVLIKMRVRIDTPDVLLN